MRCIIFLVLVLAAPAHATTWHSPDASLHLILFRYGYEPFTEHALFSGELWVEEDAEGLRITGEFEPAGGYDAEEPSLQTVFELPISFDFGDGIERFEWGDESPRVNPYQEPYIQGERLYAGLSGMVGPFLEAYGHPAFAQPSDGIAEFWVAAPLAPIPEPATAALLLSGLLVGRWTRSKTRPLG